MAAAPSVIVRKAREEDYQAVLDITREFNLGADYMETQYSDLINDPDSSYYVCEVDGKVVAFEGVSLVDDNNTLMTRSARVHEKFRGQGVLTAIRKKIYDDYKDVPGQKRIRAACTNVVRLVHSPTFRRQNRTLGIRPFTAYEPIGRDQLPALPANQNPEVREFDIQDLDLIFQNPQLVSYLFPAGFICVISWFFDPLSSNIKHIRKQRPYIIVSTELDRSIRGSNSLPDSKESQQSSASSHNQEKSKPPSGLLAVIAYYSNSAMFVVAIDIYGQPRQGREDGDVRDIIIRSLQFVISIMEQDGTTLPLTVAVTTSDDATLDRCKDILATLRFLHGIYDVVKCQYYFEQDFQRLAD